MYTRGYKGRSAAAKRDLAYLERLHAETPEEQVERWRMDLGLDEDDDEEEGEDYFPDAADTAARLPDDFFDESKRYRYQRPPSESLATRNGRGDRARLAYSPEKKRKHFIGRSSLNEEFSSNLKRRRRKLATPRTARFSTTIDMDWSVRQHRQLSVFLDNHSYYDTLLGFNYITRRPPRSRAATGRRKPEFYQQQFEPFYYAMQEHEEVFHRTWSHAVRAAVAVQQRRQRVVWPDVEWGIGIRVELCRTPLSMVWVHPRGDESKPVPSIPGDEEFPTAYEVVSLVCDRPSPPSFNVQDKKSGDIKHVENQSHYAEVPRYYISISRMAEDAEGVSLLGTCTSLKLPVEAVLKLAERLPNFLEDIRWYLRTHPDQHENALHYLTHPNPNLRRWGFVACDALRSAKHFDVTFSTEREEALLHSPELYEGDCPRLRDPNSAWSLQNLHPLYLARLASLAAGELRWREHEWEVDEVTAETDLARVEQFLTVLAAATFWIYVFCPAIVAVYLKRGLGARDPAVRVITRRTLDGGKLLQYRYRFCRGPPLLFT